jgi:hypothetical protein
MRYNGILTSAALLATLSFSVTPAFAQRGGGSSAPRGGSGARAPQGSSAPRSSAPRSQPSGAYGAAVPRAAYQSRGAYSSQPRAAYSNQARGVYSSPSRGVYASRGVYTSQSRGAYGYPARGVYSNNARAVYRYPSHYGSHAVYVAPHRYYRPYYAFRPHVSIGFGLWVGYPVAYTAGFYYGYPYPAYSGYPYPYPYAPAYYTPPAYYPPPAYGYPAAATAPAYPQASYPANSAPQPNYYEPDPQQQGSIIAQQGAASGSLSFEITPATAEVYIDGKFVGRVSDLGPTTQPIALTPGKHRVDIRASGYQTLTFDADVVAGQVVPYRGTMQALR